MEFSKTINLPKTNFSMKANLSVTENNWPCVPFTSNTTHVCGQFLTLRKFFKILLMSEGSSFYFKNTLTDDLS